MLLKKTDKTTPMQMSVENIQITGQKMIDILGPPHLTNAGNAKNKDIGFPTEVSWIYDFMGVKVKISYSSSDQANLEWSQFDPNKKPKSLKLKPVQKCEKASLFGDRTIINIFLKPYLYSLANDFTHHGYAIRAIRYLFKEWV